MPFRKRMKFLKLKPLRSTERTLTSSGSWTGIWKTPEEITTKIIMGITERRVIPMTIKLKVIWIAINMVAAAIIMIIIIGKLPQAVKVIFDMEINNFPYLAWIFFDFWHLIFHLFQIATIATMGHTAFCVFIHFINIYYAGRRWLIYLDWFKAWGKCITDNTF